MRIISLGAGVQSSTVLLMVKTGELEADAAASKTSWTNVKASAGSRKAHHEPLDDVQPERLTYGELFRLFDRDEGDTRWLASVDSQEYLAVVTYLVQRNSA